MPSWPLHSSRGRQTKHLNKTDRMWGGDRESQGESQVLAVLSRDESGEPSVEGDDWARTWLGEGAVVSGGGSGWPGPGLCSGSTQGVWGDKEGALRRSIVSWGLSWACGWRARGFHTAPGEDFAFQLTEMGLACSCHSPTYFIPTDVECYLDVIPGSHLGLTST